MPSGRFLWTSNCVSMMQWIKSALSLTLLRDLVVHAVTVCEGCGQVQNRPFPVCCNIASRIVIIFLYFCELQF